MVGIGILSGSRMEVKKDGRFTRFSAEVGVKDSTRNRSTPVSFAVYGDGRLLARTKPLMFGAPPERLVADIAGAKVVELVVWQTDTNASPVAVAWGFTALHRGAP